MAVTKEQVSIYMDKRSKGATQAVAAAKAGISERTARRVDKGDSGAGPKKRRGRTRPDPFAEVWPELRSKLGNEPDLQPITLLEWLQERYPEQYPDKLLRTLQRRVKAWRAQHGPDKEVMFPQDHAPGARGLSDFTKLKDVVVTVRSEPLDHRLYHFRLAYSGWCDVKVIIGGESFTALAEGLNEALERLGGVPEEHRTDSLSAAFKNLSEEACTDITDRYDALCRHYGMRPSRNNTGIAHENGSVEGPHGHFKRRARQAMLLRGSSDFESIEAYEQFLKGVVASINRRNAQRISAERKALQPLPCGRGTDYTETIVRVTSSSTFSYRKIIYSVPARLIGERLRLQLYDQRIEVFHGGIHLFDLPRLRRRDGERPARCIDYRHVITWLVKKPRALAGLAFRDDLLPDENWRWIYKRLRESLSTEALCKRIVSALKLTAEHGQTAELGHYWRESLERGCSPSLIELQAFICPVRAESVPPVLVCQQHTLADYDTLLSEMAHG